MAMMAVATGAASQPAPGARAPVTIQDLPDEHLTRGGRCPSAITASADRQLALVLSGGGARGLAHIGLLRVLDSLGVRPSLVVGTSMGALIGALYAGGYSARQIDSVARALPFQALFRRYSPIMSLTAGDLGSPLTLMAPTFVLEVSRGRLRIQSPIAREPQINALFNQLLLRPNLTAAGDFDRLPMRYRAVATDMRSRSTVVLGQGDLAEAVRASIAIPVVFTPVELEGRLLVDGGLSANVPIDVARRNGAARVLVSDVGSSLPDSIDGSSTAAMLAYLIDELFTQSPDSLGTDDLLIQPPVRDFRSLDFTEAVVGPLIDSGYHAAARALPDCPIASAPPVPEVQPLPGSELDLIRDRLALLADQVVYETVWLRPSLRQTDQAIVPDGDRGRLEFAPVAIPASERVASIGVSYDGHEGGRAWFATTNLSEAGGRARIVSAVSLGEWRQRLLITVTGLRRHPLPRGTDSAGVPLTQVSLPDPRAAAPPWSTLASSLPRPEISLTASREVVRLYDRRGRARDEPTTRDLFLFAGVERSLGAGQGVVFGTAMHVWSTRDAQSSDESEHSLGGMFRAVHTLPMVSGGPDPNRVPRVALEALWFDRYRRVSAQAEFELRIGSVILRPRGAGGWSDGLPLGTQLVLGGTTGFPGMRIGERRGDRMAFGSLALLRRVFGPVFARVEAGGGRTALVRPLRAAVMDETGQGWVRGAELGLVTDTPLGPFSLSVGAASTDRPVFKIRLGY